MKYAKKYQIRSGLQTYVTNKIQHYQPGAGYSVLHYERGGKAVADRQVVYMLYLNTVKDEGGTIFPHQKVHTKAIKGDLILWPADFTHPHAGIISNTTKTNRAPTARASYLTLPHINKQSRAINVDESII